MNPPSILNVRPVRSVEASMLSTRLVGGLCIRASQTRRLPRQKGPCTSCPVRTFHDDFRTFEEITEQLERLVRRNPETASLRTLSSGAHVLRLGRGDTAVERPQIWIQGGLHSQEWIGVATVMYLVDAMLSSDLLNKADVHLVPVVNVEGYRYTWREDRFMGHTLSGVNPNLNFPTAFGRFPWWLRVLMRPDSPTASMYIGPAPLSELCCSAVADELRTLRGVKLFVDLHSHGQKWMIPRGYSREPCPDHEELWEAANAAAFAVEAVHGRRYEVLQAGNLEVPVGGSALDWAYEELNIRHSYVVELRPEFLSKAKLLWAFLTQGRQAYLQGFVLPKEEIKEVGEEIFAGMEVVADRALRQDRKMLG
mmetsp:Transcript_87188/g.244660  ORF Transcript_87188/g.244660 Transcript_87188/m.244660 type:complete len:366 (-) Transcript_87188:26-1123(-)